MEKHLKHIKRNKFDKQCNLLLQSCLYFKGPHWPEVSVLYWYKKYSYCTRGLQSASANVTQMGLMCMGLVMGDSLRAALRKYGPLCTILFTWLSFTFSNTWGRLRTERLLPSSNCTLVISLFLSLSLLLFFLNHKRKARAITELRCGSVDQHACYRNGNSAVALLQHCKLDTLCFYHYPKS